MLRYSMFSRVLLVAGLCATLSGAATAETVSVKYRGNVPLTFLCKRQQGERPLIATTSLPAFACISRYRHCLDFPSLGMPRQAPAVITGGVLPFWSP